MKYHNGLTAQRCNADIGDKSPIEDPESDITCADLNDSHPTGDDCLWWTCNETTGFCEVQPTDKDGDEHIDQACAPEGATNLDCDDTNIARYIGATEICDYVDNNCNDDIDEGFAYGVAESNTWPFFQANIDSTPVNVYFTTRSTDDGITLAATFDYGPLPPEPAPEAGLAVWSNVNRPPNPFGPFDKRVVKMTPAGPEPVKPECIDDPDCNGSSWLTTKKYHRALSFTAGNDLGIVAAAEIDNDNSRYFAGVVQSEATETLVRIHTAFHEYGSLWSLGEHASHASAAWTHNGLLVLGIKACTGTCYPTGVGLVNLSVFVHLLKKDEATQAWTSASSSVDHHGIGIVPTADATPVIVGLPSGNWLTAHLQDGSARIQITLIKVADETTGDIETFTLTVPSLPEGSDLALTVGPTQDGTTTVALSYVTADNRAQAKLLSLSEAPTPQATELVTLDAPIEENETPTHAKPLVALHPDLGEWLFVWREGTSRLGMVRLQQDGTIIPNTLTYALAQDGRVLDQGFGVVRLVNPAIAPADSGAYALVTYAKDNTASVFLSGAIDCGIH